MEKIVIMGVQPNQETGLFTLLEALFPECEIQIISIGAEEFVKVPSH